MLIIKSGIPEYMNASNIQIHDRKGSESFRLKNSFGKLPISVVARTLTGAGQRQRLGGVRYLV